MGREKAVNRSDASFSRLSWFGRVSSSPTAMPIAVAPPTVTMMTMVIVPVVMMAMVIVAVVNRRTKIVPGGGFADWRHRSRVSARHWS